MNDDDDDDDENVVNVKRVDQMFSHCCDENVHKFTGLRHVVYLSTFQ